MVKILAILSWCSRFMTFEISFVLIAVELVLFGSLLACFCLFRLCCCGLWSGWVVGLLLGLLFCLFPGSLFFSAASCFLALFSFAFVCFAVVVFPCVVALLLGLALSRA
ncbi:hypothetical protein QYF36_003386 [Acer negundo]|nr:hypothetical protein QYF36_003386 [Acer negundo]